MKVKELVEILKGCNQDFEVILSKDAEGNNYSPLSGVDGEREYVPDTTYSGELADTDEDSTPNSVVLWPIN